MRIKGIPLTTVPGLITPRRSNIGNIRHVFIAICDHYEPMWQKPARHVQDDRVERWVNGYPTSVAGLSDSDGRPPQHTFFYPGDEYNAEHVDQIAGLCRRGFGDVEIHLHHRHDTSASLCEKIETYRDILVQRHGLLRKDQSGRIRYGFIHGNWALDNSHPDGDWCGVNDEITILRNTGCYADFTMPAAPSPCQTMTVNRIYYAVDDPERPKSHDQGVQARVGQAPPVDGLLMIQGPLGFDWSDRKYGLLPRLENGDLTGRRPASLSRFRLWCQAGVSVAGREDWLFVKLHTHGAQEANSQMLLGQQMRSFHENLKCFSESTNVQARNNSGFRYHYVTAWEMSSLVQQAERGHNAPAIASANAELQVSPPV